MSEPSPAPAQPPSRLENRQSYDSAADALRDYFRHSQGGTVVFKYDGEEVFFGHLVRVSRNRLLVEWAASPFHEARTYFTLIPISQIDIQSLDYWIHAPDYKRIRLVPNISGPPPIHGINQITFPREAYTRTEDKVELRIQELGPPNQQG